MPRIRKFFPKGSVLFVTSSTEHSLPFMPNLVVNTILQGIIARAQHLYGQKICHFVFMANHFHMILLVEDPDNVSNLIGYIKAKSANAINRLLGRKRHTVWCSGFDSPIILDSEATVNKIIYTYANPTKARLVDSIKEFPGISSWKAYIYGKTSNSVRWIRPSTITPLPSTSLTMTEQIEYITKLKSRNKINHKLSFNPDAWISSFQELNEEIRKQIKDKIIKTLKALEDQFCKETRSLGSGKLQKQPIDKEYSPKREGKRMICLSTSRNRRKDFIAWFKEVSEIARKVIYNFLHFNIHEPLPAGFYTPGK